MQYQNNRWWIVDKGSANGTFLQREVELPEIDVRSEDAIALRSGDCILILGELDASEKPKYWQLKFIDPAQTNQIPSKEVAHNLEYSLSSQALWRILARRRDVISLGKQERCLIDYMCRKKSPK